jgi:uncharacterized lipoprotein YbaY
MKRLALFAAALLLAGCASVGRYQPSYLDGTVATTAVVPSGDTTLKVRLLDVSRPGAPAQVLAEQYQDQPKAFPAPFSLCYDARAIKPDHVYTVEASLYVKGELKMVSSGQPRVLAADSPAKPELTVQAIDQ